MVSYMKPVDGRLGTAPVEQFFNHVFGQDGGRSPLPVAVWQDDDHAYIELEMPGVAKEDLDIVVENGRLSVSAERKVPEGERHYWVNERRYGQFQRLFNVPEAYSAESIQADLTNGVLTLTLTKRPEAQPRKVEVKVS